ncbi:OmpA family protein [Ahrensia kielensis]|uniref:OmpA family protein n=1 Tax=Ahrensia kielensis TaxID=76980 RepID=UPI00036F600C|nr:OmpA family protein [Ahrensia kielensis]
MERQKVITRRAALAALVGAASLVTSVAHAQSTPSAQSIERSLSAPTKGLAPAKRVSPRIFKQRPELRRIAPSINIQSINFAFGSDRIPQDQYWKVERIAVAMNRILQRNPREVFLIEGHTDAVGSNTSNLALSERRARSLARQLTRFGVSPRAMETIGYGEEDLLVQTQREDWRNRRVALRRITDFITR